MLDRSQPPPSSQLHDGAARSPGNGTSELENARPASLQSSDSSPPAKDDGTTLQHIRNHFSGNIKPTRTDLLLLTCCFISGLVDSTVYRAFGTFVSMQTGNTIFVGLGPSTPHTTTKPYGWAKSLVSIVCFAIGCLFFSRTVHRLGHMKRISLVASFAMQTTIVFIAAAVVQGGRVQGRLDDIGDDIDWWTVLPIALLSFQSSGQIVGSRSLGLSEVPTVVLTSMIHDISTDRNLLAGFSANVKRNRRVVAFLTLLVGAVVGGFVAEGTGKMEVPLWIAGSIKGAITLCWALWPQEKEIPA